MKGSAKLTREARARQLTELILRILPFWLPAGSTLLVYRTVYTPPTKCPFRLLSGSTQFVYRTFAYCFWYEELTDSEFSPRSSLATSVGVILGSLCRIVRYLPWFCLTKLVQTYCCGGISDSHRRDFPLRRLIIEGVTVPG